MIPRNLYDESKQMRKLYWLKLAGVITRESGGEKVDVSFFGIEPDQFLAPKLTEGELFANDDEAVADSSLKEEYDIKIGDTVKLAGNEKKLKIVGYFTENARFNVAPVLYTTIGAYQEIRFETKIPAR